MVKISLDINVFWSDWIQLWARMKMALDVIRNLPFCNYF